MFRSLIEEVRLVVEAVSPGKKRARHGAIGRELHRGDRPINDHGNSMHDGRAWSAKRENPSASDFERHGREARSRLGRIGGKVTTVAQRVGGDDELARRAKAGGIDKQIKRDTKWITSKGQIDKMKDDIGREQENRKRSPSKLPR